MSPPSPLRNYGLHSPSEDLAAPKRSEGGWRRESDCNLTFSVFAQIYVSLREPSRAPLESLSAKAYRRKA